MLDQSRAQSTPGWLRAVEIVAGLISGGLVAIGLVLVVLQWAAPSIAPGEDLAAATGPGWGRIAAQLGLGVVGEIAVALRRYLPVAGRALAACAVIVAAAVVLYVVWWA